jgi:hypothetical protein
MLVCCDGNRDAFLMILVKVGRMAMARLVFIISGLPLAEGAGEGEGDRDRDRDRKGDRRWVGIRI